MRWDNILKAKLSIMLLAPSSVLSQRVIHHTPPLIEVTLQHSRPLNRWKLWKLYSFLYFFFSLCTTCNILHILTRRLYKEGRPDKENDALESIPHKSLWNLHICLLLYSYARLVWLCLSLSVFPLSLRIYLDPFYIWLGWVRREKT